MLDPDEMAEYEAWKQRKLTSHPDLSVLAFNTEMSAMAVAYDEAIDAAVSESDYQKRTSLKNANPYRFPGMRGHMPHATSSVSGNNLIPGLRQGRGGIPIEYNSQDNPSHPIHQ